MSVSDFYDYNTQKPKLLLPEYGRNVHRMVEKAKTIENRDDRNRYARMIISVMGNMNPHLRDINDFKHKLWDHLAIMANFGLDIDSPYPIPTKESFEGKPNRIPYNDHNIRYKFYGKIIEGFIKKASEIAPSSDKENLISLLANHMKKSYLLWNKEIVDDDIIFQTIQELSQGKIQIGDSLKLTASREIIGMSKRKKQTKQINNPKRDR